MLLWWILKVLPTELATELACAMNHVEQTSIETLRASNPAEEIQILLQTCTATQSPVQLSSLQMNKVNVCNSSALHLQRQLKAPRESLRPTAMTASCTAKDDSLCDVLPI